MKFGGHLVGTFKGVIEKKKVFFICHFVIVVTRAIAFVFEDLI